MVSTSARSTSRRSALWLCAALVAVGVGAVPARAATVVGQTKPPAAVPRSCVAALAGVQHASGPSGPSYTIPSPGVITSFSHEAGDGTGSIRVAVYQETLDPYEYFTVGRSDVKPVTSDILNVFPTRIPVEADDLLGITVVEPDINCAFSGGVGDQLGTCIDCDPAPGEFLYEEDDHVVDEDRLNIAAILEPDADGDGFGDESQDQCPTDPTTQGPCGTGGGGGPPGPGPAPDLDAPDARIKKHPPKKTDERKAKFTFAADEPGVTFICKLDGRPWKPCTSPTTVKVKGEGKHTFSVIAEDEAGNASIPIDYGWRWGTYYT